jgi:hypothetical protein
VPWKNQPLEEIKDERLREQIRLERERRAAAAKPPEEPKPPATPAPLDFEEIRASILAEVKAVGDELVEVVKAAKAVQENEALEFSALELSEMAEQTIVLTDDEKRALEEHRKVRDARVREIQAQADEEKRIDDLAGAALRKKAGTLTPEETDALTRRVTEVLKERW